MPHVSRRSLVARGAGARLLAVAIILGPFLWCFGATLAGTRSFVFRDSAHYYFPLFQWLSRQWGEGRVPLWNPQENCGVPVLADTTSSVFYPGKLVFALPLPYAVAYNAYVAGHVLLAAIAAYGLARRWHASRPAAVLCALSYAFGGNVLFQYCNVVFLVGAAWLPWAVWATDRMLVQRRLGWALGLGAVLALMVLGGDPHGAYHAGLLAALYAWLLWRHARRRRPRLVGVRGGHSCLPSHCVPVRLPWVRRRLTLLTAAAMCGAVLAAVQMLPASQWLRVSERAAHRAPRSVYEVPAFMLRNENPDERYTVAGGLFGRPVSGTHHEHIYLFSVGPWRLAECIWPNFSGRMFPEDRRWTNAIPAESQVWTPSLYQGLLPLLLALASWRMRRGGPRVRWLSWSLLLATLGSFGGFGLGWLIQELRCGLWGADPDQFPIGAPVGGLYWLLVTCLPGYAYFRYPAKLLTVSALAVSLLAARGFDRWRATWPERTEAGSNGPAASNGGRGWLAGLVGLSVVGWLLTFVFAAGWRTWMQDVPADSLLGPFDADGALRDLRGALLHTALLAACFHWLVSGRLLLGRRLVPAAAVLLTAVELAIAQGWLVPTAPTAAWQRPAWFAEQITEQMRQRGETAATRVFRATRQDWAPAGWSRTASPDRPQAGLRWDRDTLFPKHHLDTGLSLLEADDTLVSQDYRAWLRVARQHGQQRTEDTTEPHPLALDALGARYLLGPEDFPFAAAQRIQLASPHASAAAGDDRPANATLWRSDGALPRAWIVHQVERLPPLIHSNPQAVEQRTREVLFPHRRPRDLRRMAVVETSEAIDAASPDARAAPRGESCQLLVDQPDRVEIEAELAVPGLVVLSDLFYPGWQATVQGPGETLPRPAAVIRTNRIMRGIWLPTGRHHITYVYRPTSFYLGAVLSLLGWAAVGAFWAVTRVIHVGRNKIA